jgi:hypothetical protein
MRGRTGEAVAEGLGNVAIVDSMCFILAQLFRGPCVSFYGDFFNLVQQTWHRSVPPISDRLKQCFEGEMRSA